VDVVVVRCEGAGPGVGLDGDGQCGGVLLGAGVDQEGSACGVACRQAGLFGDLALERFVEQLAVFDSAAEEGPQQFTGGAEAFLDEEDVVAPPEDADDQLRAGRRGKRIW
jgi:hypothetical protein